MIKEKPIKRIVVIRYDNNLPYPEAAFGYLMLTDNQEPELKEGWTVLLDTTDLEAASAFVHEIYDSHTVTCWICGGEGRLDFFGEWQHCPGCKGKAKVWV